MALNRKLVVAANLRRLVPRPWNRFALRLGLKPKNFYTYLREKDPKSAPGHVLAAVARELDLSMDDLLDEAARGAAARAPRAAAQGDEEDLVAAWRRLDPGRRDYGLMFLKVLADGQCLEWALAEAHAYAAERTLRRASTAPAGARRELRAEAGRSGDTPPRGPNRRDSET